MRASLLLVLPLLTIGCADQEGPATAAKRQGTPSGDFQSDTTVQLLSPTNGETVGTTFEVQFLAGASVAKVRIEADGEILRTASVDSATGEGSVSVTVDEGRHDLRVIALDGEELELSAQEITIRADADGEDWVTITSPADGANVTNPVTFAVDASSAVADIELLADGWTLGHMAPDGVFTYTFSGTGYAREIQAIGTSTTGEVVSSDTIDITIEPGTDPDPSDFDDLVMELVGTYPTDGTNGYYWPSGLDWLGNTRDLTYQGTLLSAGDPQGRCYCVGLTLEVFMRAFQQLDLQSGGDGDLNGISLGEMDEFIADWFVRDLWGRGIVDAMENYGIGDPVTDWEDVRAGDIVQFWRHSGSGHNNIFIEWERDGGDNIIGLTYWSTQSSTDGIDYNTEYFGASGSSIDPNHFFVGRVRMPEDWEPWL